MENIGNRQDETSIPESAAPCHARVENCGNGERGSNDPLSKGIQEEMVGKPPAYPRDQRKIQDLRSVYS